ncbi:hypothetical protein [Photorhabdus stackebrandtii]|uniref:hypothetical protein n=1 Tax=Photorhabdus stackebrandtii TaxID=1123042 RepID=UPI001F6209C6|nr:hypothetical protein [Photorhabdus stackebrandtii]
MNRQKAVIKSHREEKRMMKRDLRHQRYWDDGQCDFFDAAWWYIPVIFQVVSLLAALAHPGHIVSYAPGDSLPCRRDAS